MTLPLDTLLARAYVPYSRAPRAAAAVLADGQWIPGVRVECASFPLTIPAVTAALTGAQATVGLSQVVGLVSSHALTAAELALFQEAVGRPYRSPSDTVAFVSELGAHPTLTSHVDVSNIAIGLEESVHAPPERLLREARQLAIERARVPNSDFPVGCLVDTTEGFALPGVNVEFEEWTHGLCAERTGLALTLAYGLKPRALYVSCVNAPGGTPCGACRQVIAELIPTGHIWLDMGTAPPKLTSASTLLPEAFVGASLRQPSA